MAQGMAGTAYNFAAGPATMPQAVLARARDELFARGEDGAGLLERPFSHPATRAMLADARDRLAALLSLSGRCRILFLAGGAMHQFAALPMNLLAAGQSAVYADTGYWARRAHGEALRVAPERTATLLAREAFPETTRVALPGDCGYCHLTLNETADGVAWPYLPDTGDVPLVADATSNFLAAPLDCARFGVIYASAQKNIGPAGLTVVIVRDDLLQREAPQVPSIWSYRLQAEQEGRVNTPPLPAIRIAALVFEWIAEQGGLAALAEINRRKAATVYAAIADSDGFYRCDIAARWRSQMNVCFTLPDEALSEAFIAAAESAGLHNLRGHPRLGGIRASLYNAMPEAGARALAEFMAEFARTRG